MVARSTPSDTILGRTEHTFSIDLWVKVGAEANRPYCDVGWNPQRQGALGRCERRARLFEEWHSRVR